MKTIAYNFPVVHPGVFDKIEFYKNNMPSLTVTYAHRVNGGAKIISVDFSMLVQKPYNKDEYECYSACLLASFRGRQAREHKAMDISNLDGLSNEIKNHIIDSLESVYDKILGELTIIDNENDWCLGNKI